MVKEAWCGRCGSRDIDGLGKKEVKLNLGNILGNIVVAALTGAISGIGVAGKGEAPLVCRACGSKKVAYTMYDWEPETQELHKRKYGWYNSISPEEPTLKMENDYTTSMRAALEAAHRGDWEGGVRRVKNG